jgi:acetyltransferase-like isoleucine patch superfamily enzyme
MQNFRLWLYRKKGYDIGDGCIIEKIKLDKVYPQGIHIGKECLIASGVVILTHDHCKRIGPSILDCYVTNTIIGNRCFVALNSIIMPGVTIGDECIVGAGSVVTKDVPGHCVVAGNPARIIRRGISMSRRAELTCWNPEEGWVNQD